MKITAKFIIVSVLLLSVTILAQTDIPYLTGRVTDNAQILSPETKQSLTESLKEHENRTGNQIAILTVSTIYGESIEDYAVSVFEEWKLGQKGKDNGVLIVVVPNDRRMRIEVGYGLEGTLTDGMAGQIIHSVMTPQFKNGDYDGGIADGARAVIDVLEGVELSDVTDDSLVEESDGFIVKGADMGIIERVLIGAFIFGIIGLFTVLGILTPGIGWFLYFFLIPFWAMFPIFLMGTRGAFICLISYLILFPLAKILFKNSDWYQKAQKDLKIKGSTSIGGFKFSTRSSGGSWSSGGSSFSGGGGSSGGGGASGSW